MRLTDDLVAGMVFVFFGLLAIVVGQEYGFGTAARMRSGFVPITVGAILAILGAILAGGAILRPASAKPIRFFEIRPLIIVLAGILCFAGLVNRAGFIPALVVLIAVVWFADYRGKLIHLPILVAGLIAAVVAIFYYGLGMPLRMWW